MKVARQLSYGQFYGDSSDAVEAQGFSFSEVANPVGQHVPVHTHGDAHFVLIVDGEYLTSARRFKNTCGPGAIIFNPPGTTHRDRFRSPTGRFFTVSVRPERYVLLSDAGTVIDGAVGFDEGELTWLGARMHREFRQRDSLSPTVLEALALEILAHTARQERFTSKQPPSWVSIAVESETAARRR